MSFLDFKVEKMHRAITIWLYVGVFLVIVQSMIGGITRLSGSGLSITEWDVITGAIPPLNQEDWQIEFEKYKESPQYRFLNSDFDISDFKSIYFWEWFHRLWARMIGVVFAVYFIYFLVKKCFSRSSSAALITLFVLGALQGAIGWIMVQSGLEGDMTYVKPTRLAVHFVMAMILGSYVMWLALQTHYKGEGRISALKFRNAFIVILMLVFIQFIFGALIAGHKAATVAPTWPTMNGVWVPENLWADEYGHPLINNKLTIQFIHRSLAYLIFILINVVCFVIIRNANKTYNVFKFAKWPLIFVWLQLILGICTVLSSNNIIPNDWRSFETFALLHQLVGMLTMVSLVMMIYFTSGKPKTEIA